MKRQIRPFAFFLFIVITSMSTASSQEAASSALLISARDARNRLLNDTTVVLLDVRTPEEHLAERIQDSRLIPVQELDQRFHELDSLRSRTIIVYCRTGHRSGMAATLLRREGFAVLSLEGGINQWKSEHFETIIGPPQ